MKKEHKLLFRLSWGIHRKTLMSRDIGDPYYFDTIEQCKEKALELKTYFKENFGYSLWFATAINTKTKEHTTLLNGAPYY